jgi:tetratricopeptide (TPR) repeat protein
VWTFLAETCLIAGNYTQARDALNRYLALEPDDPHGFTLLGQLEQFEGEQASAMRRFQHALGLVPGFAPARLALGEAEVVAGAWDDAGRRLDALAADLDAPASFRIHAAFALSDLRLASGRFREAIEPLQRLAAQIRREKIREAMALAQQGRAQAELGHYGEAQALSALAVQRSPGSATRYLFARGIVAQIRGDAAGLRAAAGEIRAQRIEGQDEHAKLSREDAARAAAYLEGLALIGAGEFVPAVEQLRRVASMPGYRYAIYERGLAQALLASGRAREALPSARAAAALRDPGDARLDLEIDRTRAILLEAEILKATGRQAEAADSARKFLARWTPEDHDQTERLLAERLVAGTADRVSAGSAQSARPRPSPSN